MVAVALAACAGARPPARRPLETVPIAVADPAPSPACGLPEGADALKRQTPDLDGDGKKDLLLGERDPSARHTRWHVHLLLGACYVELGVLDGELPEVLPQTSNGLADLAVRVDDCTAGPDKTRCRVTYAFDGTRYKPVRTEQIEDRPDNPSFLH